MSIARGRIARVRLRRRSTTVVSAQRPLDKPLAAITASQFR